MQTYNLAPDAPYERLEEGLSRRYLALTADVAGRLLAAEDPATMIEDMFDLIRSELRLDIFINFRAENDRLVLEAQGGLSASEAESIAVLAIGQAVCGCVARDRIPYHATAIQRSDDPIMSFVKALGLDAYACTPLVHGATLIGTLSFGRRWTDRFSEEELSFLRTVCHYVALAKHRLRIEAELRDSVASRERLLVELNHRVRNALQLAISLIVSDLGGLASDEARGALQRAADRLQVLAAAHRPLYSTAQPDTVDLQTLLQGVVEQTGVTPTLLEADGTYALPIERAVALALLVHEIVARHRQPAVQRLTLSAGPLQQGNHSLRVELHGQADTQFFLAGGNRLVAALTRQLRIDATVAEGGDLILIVPLLHG